LAIRRHRPASSVNYIVSKRRGTAYESGHSERWLKSINPNAAARTGLLEAEWN
jgi:hypothetical protein